MRLALALAAAASVALVLIAPAEARKPAPPAPTLAANTKADGKNFVADARLMMRVVACAGTEPLPAALDVKVHDAHCKEMAKRYQRFRDKYVTPAQAFLAGVLPAGLPTTVVYPFGGGDLVGALVTYPQATDITTMSLEHPGDPSRLRSLDKAGFKRSLSLFRNVIRGLLVNNDSASDTMKEMERGAIPGQLSFFLTGLAIMGFEPVELRYFEVTPSGELHYYTEAEVLALADQLARRKKGSWINTDFSAVFTNMELVFRKAGDATAPLITHRHLAANLANAKFKGTGLEQYLARKGKIAAMTKAASYLLWMNDFSSIREYLLANMVFMVSDSTGVPPRFAQKAGFAQTTYGTYTGSYFNAGATDNNAFLKLWAAQPKRKIKFRYGYPDANGNVHLLITQPAAR